MNLDYDKIKNQSILRKQDVDLIIDTYRNRTETLKYSRKVSLEEITKNEYNLNIPRYIDTFEAEESIDIEAIAREAKALDDTIEDIDKTIANFCSELNISTPF